MVVFNFYEILMGVNLGAPKTQFLCVFAQSAHWTPNGEAVSVHMFNGWNYFADLGKISCWGLQ